MSEQEIPETPTPQRAGESGPHFVEELNGATDYWMTLTDAARVTRRQEVTIRRWVAAGTLPVRRQAVGTNQRTRHVRASDLARLTPIVDPTAAITGAPANADLLSIPVQHARLIAAQEVVLQEISGVQQHLDVLDRQIQLQATTQQRAIQNLDAQVAVMQQQYHEESEQQRQVQTALLTHLQTQMEAAHQQLHDLMTHNIQEWQACVVEIQLRLDTQGMAITAQQQSHDASLTQIQQNVDTQIAELHEELQRQDTALNTFQQEAISLYQQVQLLTTTLHTVEQDHHQLHAEVQQIQHTVVLLQEHQQHWQRHQTLSLTVLASRVRRQRFTPTRQPFRRQRPS